MHPFLLCDSNSSFKEAKDGVTSSWIFRVTHLCNSLLKLEGSLRILNIITNIMILGLHLLLRQRQLQAIQRVHSVKIADTDLIRRRSPLFRPQENFQTSLMLYKRRPEDPLPLLTWNDSSLSHQERVVSTLISIG